jgi:hypothetical protein
MRRQDVTEVTGTVDAELVERCGSARKCALRRDSSPSGTGTSVAQEAGVLTSRSFWIRTLRLAEAAATLFAEELDGDPGAYVHARSRFRSLRDPERVALYAVQDAHDRLLLDALRPGEDDEHTLGVVREFRRVPLEASALALALLRARPGETAAVLATLAHFVERAVSRYQPAYILLAHSREQPRLSVLLLGVDEVAALASAVPEAFSLDALLPDLRPRLAAAPEWFTYEADTSPVTTAV